MDGQLVSIFEIRVLHAQVGRNTYYRSCSRKTWVSENSMANSIGIAESRCSCKRNGQNSFVVERELWSLRVVGVRQQACARFLDKQI